MATATNLRQTLAQLDGTGYKAYKEIKGSYSFQDFTLIIDRVQGDPFAAPSQLRVKVSQKVAKFPPQFYASSSRSVALRDYLARQFDRAARSLSTARGTGKSGLIAISCIGQQVLDRTTTFIDDQWVEMRFVVGLPARGRTILGYQAAALLCEDIPQIVQTSLIYNPADAQKIQNWVETVEDADFIRQQLEGRGLVAFVVNGAILPRRTGADQRPLSDGAIPFQSPPSLAVEFNCPNAGLIQGMGIPEGITLIVGGGYHGKSTLLRALSVGVYNHRPGDGREGVITHSQGVKIRAEDGRSVAGVNIAPFINQLPQGRSTINFCTDNASGSTSQAANIMEALEAGAKLLLVDEDTSATNFMIRDRRMQLLIAKEKEPITPFIDKVSQLYRDYGVSTILVMGGSGDYFDVANTVIAMENFQPFDVTAKAKKIAQENQTEREQQGGDRFGLIKPRVPNPDSIDPSHGDRSVKVKVRDVDEVVFGSEALDLGAVEQIVNPGQLRAIVAALVYAKNNYIDGDQTLPQILDQVLGAIATKGLDILTDFPQGDLAKFRRFELAAALNRLRSLKVI